MSNIEVGAVIKSYDFPGITDCYIIGTVIDVDATKGFITSRVIKAVSGGKLYQFPDSEFVTKFPGQSLFDDMYTDRGYNRVEVIG